MWFRLWKTMMKHGDLSTIQMDLYPEEVGPKGPKAAPGGLATVYPAGKAASPSATTHGLDSHVDMP